jgi:N6-L-threonylcarbamoyladenine synthase
LNILGIETSCDETGASVVKDGNEILSVVTHTQIEAHASYYGVVPELASRMHLEMITLVVEQALKEAAIGFKDIDAIAVTNAPGLIGSLLIGISAAKSYSFIYDIPIIPVNHLYAHVYAPNLETEVLYPNIGLIVSGGHTMLTVNKSPVEWQIVGTTIDDAVGEAFDKVARYLDLEYPGGPVIDKLSKNGDDKAFNYPLVMLKDKKDRYNFSYSGLKTAVVNFSDKFLNEGHEKTKENIAASFQKSAIDVLYLKAKRLSNDKGIDKVIISGGVACNSYLRKKFAEDKEITCYIPSPKLCTDNAAIIAGLAYHIKERGGLDLDASSRFLSSKLKGKGRIGLG